MGSIVSDKILPPRQAKPGVSRRTTYTADRTVPGDSHRRVTEPIADPARGDVAVSRQLATVFRRV
jgi:hypothetical protein